MSAEIVSWPCHSVRCVCARDLGLRNFEPRNTDEASEGIDKGLRRCCKSSKIVASTCSRRSAFCQAFKWVEYLLNSSNSGSLTSACSNVQGINPYAHLRGYRDNMRSIVLLKVQIDREEEVSGEMRSLASREAK